MFFYQKKAWGWLGTETQRRLVYLWVFETIWGHLFMHFFQFVYNNKLKTRIMCFIKKVELDVEPIIYPCEHQCFYYSMQCLPFNSQYNFMQNPYPPPHPSMLNLPFLMHKMITDLAATVQRINSNNSILYRFAEKLNQNESMIEEAAVELAQNLSKVEGRTVSAMTRQPHCQLNQIPFFSKQAIVSKIFGQKEYKYKLNLNQQFPKVIYKERNLSIAVKISNPNGQALYNANLIHLCVGVCNNLGQWIVEQSGDFFIQGKIEIDLYHGQAEFKKISPKDVSRHFNGGVVSIIIYPKKSLVNFTGEVTKYEKIIDPDLIEPLIIRDIVIKAKKKCKA